MGFRRDGQKALHWKKWRQASENTRVAAEVTSEVMGTEEAWWDYLNHEANVPLYDYRHSYPLTPQQEALKELVLTWPGGAETMLGEAFRFLEQRKAKPESERENEDLWLPTED